MNKKTKLTAISWGLIAIWGISLIAFILYVMSCGEISTAFIYGVVALSVVPAFLLLIKFKHLSVPYRVVGIFPVLVTVWLFHNCLTPSPFEPPPFKPTEIKVGAERQLFIPKNLEEAYEELDRGLSKGMKKAFTTDPDQRTPRQRGMMMNLHFGLGMWIRNNWGLWGGSELSEWFRSQGIGHPDDMSGIIFDSYIAHLKGEEYPLKETIAEYQLYWNRAASPQPMTNEVSGQIIDVVDAQQMYDLNDGRCIHVGENKTTQEPWFYEFEKGWYKPTEEELSNLVNIVNGTTRNLE